MENSKMEDLIGGMPSWTEEANCKGADADIFFPERGASTRKAKSICRACSVQEDCLEFAIEQSEKGESKTATKMKTKYTFLCKFDSIC